MEQTGEKPRSWCDKHHIFCVLLAAILLTVIFTYPAIFHMDDALIGIKEDNQQNYWVIWYLKQAVTRNDIDVYQTDMLYYPLGANLALHTLDLTDSLFFALPLESLFSITVTYNILILAGFALTLLFTYMLVLYLTNNKMASFLAGLIFAFAPFHTAHALHHINLASIEFIPLYILFLIKMFDKPCWKNSILAAVSLTLLSLNSWYYLVYMVIFSLFYLLWKFIIIGKGTLSKEVLKYIAYSAILFFVLIAPFIYPIFTASISAERLSNTWGQELFVTDLIAPVLPPALHTLSQLNHHALAPIYLKLSGNVWESTRFLGYLVLILSSVAIINLPFAKTGFWWITGLVYLILSFGPQLHIMGNPVLNYMPYYFFAKIPLLNLARIPSRFAFITMLCLAVLAAYAFTWLCDAYKQKRIHGMRLSTLFFFLFSLTILFEFSTIPTPMTHTHIPNFYKTIADDPQQYTLLEIPFFDWRTNDEAMFLQTIHHKRLMFGALSHIPKEKLVSYLDYPFFKVLAIPKDYLPQYQDADTSILKQYGVRYVIIHPEYFKHQDEFDMILNFIDTKFKKVQQDDPNIIVYQVE